MLLTSKLLNASYYHTYHVSDTVNILDIID